MSGKWRPELLIESEWLNGVVNGSYNDKLFVYIFKYELTATLFENHPDASIFKVEDLVAIKIQQLANTRPEFSSNHKVLQIRPISYTSDILKITSNSKKNAIFILGKFRIEGDDSIFNDFLGRAHDSNKLLEPFKKEIKKNTLITLSVMPKRDPNNTTRSFLHIVKLPEIEQGIYQKPKENSKRQCNCLGLIRHENPMYYFIWTKDAIQDLKLQKNEYTDYRNGVGKWIRFREYSHQDGDIFVSSPVEDVPPHYNTKERDGFVQIIVECLGVKMNSNGVRILETNSVGEVADILNVLDGKEPLGFDAPIHLANQENIHRHEANGNKLPSSSSNGASRKTCEDYAKLSCAEFCKELYASERLREAFKKINPELYEAFVDKVNSLP